MNLAGAGGRGTGRRPDLLRRVGRARPGLRDSALGQDAGEAEQNVVASAPALGPTRDGRRTRPEDIGFQMPGRGFGCVVCRGVCDVSFDNVIVLPKQFWGRWSSLIQFAGPVFGGRITGMKVNLLMCSVL